MERLVESLVEEQLDETPITPLSSHPSYKPVATVETTGAVQDQLKSLIVQVLREANSLPIIPLSPQQDAGNTENLKSKTYEDILATTILNKIVEKCQHTKSVSSEEVDGSGAPLKSVNTKVKATCEFKIGPLGGTSQALKGKAFPDGREVAEDSMWNRGQTSLLCTTVEHIEEVITRYSPNEYEAEETIPNVTKHQNWDVTSDLDMSDGHRAPCPELGRDIVDGSALLEDMDSGSSLNVGIEFINDLETWEENWLFQKKKGRPHGTRSMVHHPVPVPMLVPCPGPDQTCRTLIGDVDAEETSDLSECSDSIYDDPIFTTKTRSLRTTDSKSPSLRVEGLSSSEDEDNTEGWVEARNEKLLLATPVDSGEGSLEVTEEELNLPQPHERITPATDKLCRPVPKPRKATSALNNHLVCNRLENKPPTGITNKSQRTGERKTDNDLSPKERNSINSVNILDLKQNQANVRSVNVNSAIPKQRVENNQINQNSDCDNIMDNNVNSENGNNHLDESCLSKNRGIDNKHESGVDNKHRKEKSNDDENEHITKDQKKVFQENPDGAYPTKTDQSDTGNELTEYQGLKTPLIKENGDRKITTKDNHKGTNGTSDSTDESYVKDFEAGQSKTPSLYGGSKEESNAVDKPNPGSSVSEKNGEGIAKESYDREHEAEVAEIEILNTPPKPGTIAEREHAKWLKGIPLENNPYSKENIEKRNRQRLFDLSRSVSSDQTESNDETDHTRSETIVVTTTSSSPELIKRYSRDYYINNSCGTPSSHLSSSNTSLSSIGKVPVKSSAPSSSHKGLPQSQEKSQRRSKDMDDLKRPPNVSSEDSVPTSDCDDHAAMESEENKNVTQVPRSNEDDSLSNEKMEEGDGNQQMESQNKDETESDAWFTDIKTIQSTQSVKNESSAPSNSPVPLGETQSGVENKSTSQVVRKMSSEKSASQSDLLKSKETDPKYMSTQTLPEKKKKKGFLSSIKRFLTKKKSKSIGKCESNQLFAEKSLQNIYSDTWNQKQFDEQLKRTTFDDKLLQTFKNRNLNQVQSFIENEQAHGANNFNYLKDMDKDSESVNLNGDSLLTKEDVKEATDINHDDEKESKVIDQNIQDLKKDQVAEKTQGTEQDKLTENVLNTPLTFPEDRVEITSVEHVSEAENMTNMVTNTRASPQLSNKSNSSTLERSRNNNSQPIQVMLEDSDHPCGDIIVHVDSDNGIDENSSDSAGHIGTSEESSPELQRHKRDCKTGEKDNEHVIDAMNVTKHELKDISDQERATIIIEIDKIFESEGLNITFNKKAIGLNGESIDDPQECCSKSIRLSNNFSLPSTLDRSILISKQEEVHKKNIDRKTKDSKSEDIAQDHIDCVDSEEMVKNESPIDVTTTVKIKFVENHKIGDKFDVAEIDMQKSFLVQPDSVDYESSEHDIPNDITNNTSASLEEYVLRNSLRHKTLKARNAVVTSNFSMNPIFSQGSVNNPVQNVLEDVNVKLLPNDNDENILYLPTHMRENGSSTPENSTLDPDYNFQLRKTPESGYSSTVEAGRGVTPDLTCTGRDVTPDLTCETGRGVTPDLICETGRGVTPDLTCETGRGVNPDLTCETGRGVTPDLTCETGRGVTPDLTCELRKVSECDGEFVIVSKINCEHELLPKATDSEIVLVNAQSIATGDFTDREDELIDINSKSIAEYDFLLNPNENEKVSETNQNNSKEDHVDVQGDFTNNNFEVISESKLKQPENELVSECIISTASSEHYILLRPMQNEITSKSELSIAKEEHDEVENQISKDSPKPITNIEVKQPDVESPNKGLLEPGMILDDRIVLERRNILQKSPVLPSKCNANVRTINKDKTKEIDQTDSGNRKDSSSAVQTKSESNIVNNDDSKNIESTDLGGQLRMEFEKLSDVFTKSVENLTAENAELDPKTKLTVDKNNVGNEPKCLSQDCDVTIVPYDHLKELSNARNTMNYNTRL